MFTKQHKINQTTIMGKNNKLSAQDANYTSEVASARVHVERSIQRIKIFKIFTSKIPVNMLYHIDNIMFIIAGIVNLSNPILSDEKFICNIE